MVIAQAKITSKGQINLPARIMRRLGLHAGDMIAFEEKEDHVEVQPAREKISALDLPKRFGNTQMKLSAERLRILRKKAWTLRYRQYLKNNPTHKKPSPHESRH